LHLLNLPRQLPRSPPQLPKRSPHGPKLAPSFAEAVAAADEIRVAPAEGLAALNEAFASFH